MITYKDITCSSDVAGDYNDKVAFKLTQIASAAGKMAFKVEISPDSDTYFSTGNYNCSLSVTIAGTTKTLTTDFSVSANQWYTAFESFEVTSTATSLTPSIGEIHPQITVSGYTCSGYFSGSLDAMAVYAAYSLTVSADGGISSYAIARTGSVLTGDSPTSVVYRGDVLTVTATPKTNFTVESGTGTVTVSGATTITLISYTTLTLNQGDHTTITVTRNGTALASGAKLYCKDVLTIAFAADTGYEISASAIVMGTKSVTSPVTVSDAVTASATADPMATVSIYDGSKWVSYQIYIGDGSNWNLYQAYIGDGSKWNQYY